ncbi:hypothetical protein KUCAC02_021416 [Chaenocephalus aceratus]|uniref:Uncharacterized protein n=1 Tax=Chaenocephalus aceratus TaxID=36190 RepID=A0ACB9XGK1_CHAAC|nr:hypothetical protein KUCAC02_021416 [Chaenocephalus aceratus]
MLSKSTSSELQAHVTELKMERNRLRNDVSSMIKTAKKNFINVKTEENKNKPCELWKLLNNQLGCSKKLKTRFSNLNIKTDNRLITDKLDVAKYLNIFFTNIATTLVKKLPSHTGLFGVDHIMTYYKDLGVRKDDFSLARVTTAEVLIKLSALQPNKATGHDNIPSKFLRDTATAISPVIAHIINLSIKQGKVHKDFKIARVTPLHKKGSKLDPGNYRPVSILTSISKVMEKIVYEQVEKYLAEKKLIYEFQSGFRTSHSTDTCLLYLSDHIKQEVDEDKYCGMVMLDLQKAFDTVNHPILIDKLKAIGFDKLSVSWMQSYLEGREQMVEVNGTLSPPPSQ